MPDFKMNTPSGLEDGATVGLQHSYYNFISTSVNHDEDTTLQLPAVISSSEGVFFTRTFAFSVVLVIFNFTALILNGFVIYVVARYRNMRNTVTLCFVNLAITDIALVAFSMSSSLRRTTGIDLQAITGCVVPVYLHGVTVVCTGLTMSFLAFDRYQVVSQPFKAIKDRTGRKLMLCFLAIWMVSFAVYAFLPIITVDVGTHCILVYRNVETITGNRLYHTFKALMNYFIPISISGFFYTKIFLILMRMAPPGEVTKSSSGVAMNSSQKIRRQRLRGIRSATLVLLLFTVCYLPTTVLSLWRAYDSNFLDTEYYKYHLITGLISRINVIANPFIYSLSAASFKKQIAQMFGCCCCTCMKPNRREQSNVSSGNSREHTLSTE